MTDGTRTELLQFLTRLSAVTDDLRFGQLICALTSMTDGRFSESVYDVEDEELLQAAREFTATMEARAKERTADHARAS